MKTYVFVSRRYRLVMELVPAIILGAWLVALAACALSDHGRSGSAFGPVFLGFIMLVGGVLSLVMPERAGLSDDGTVTFDGLLRQTTVPASEIESVTLKLPNLNLFRTVGASVSLAGGRGTLEFISGARALDEFLWDIRALNRSLDVRTRSFWGIPRSDPMAVFALHRLAVGEQPPPPRR